jgi:hypothetical protein
LNNFGDALRSGLASAFSQEPAAGASPSKKGKKTDGAARDASPQPFSKAQSSWLEQALGSALLSFGEHVEKKVEMLEQSAESTAKAIEVLTDRADDHEKTMHDFDERMKQMQIEWDDKLAGLKKDTECAVKMTQDQTEEMKKLKEMKSGPCSATQLFFGQVPYELRVHGMIGSLGWDADGALLKARAAESLLKVGILPEEWHTLSPMIGKSGKGSGCEIWFRSADGLAQGRNKMRNGCIAYDGRRPVWIDAKKSREEMQPARMTHRIHEYLADIASSRSNGIWTFSKNPGARTVHVAFGESTETTCAMRMFGQAIRWQPWAVKNLTAEEMTTSEEYARDR